VTELTALKCWSFSDDLSVEQTNVNVQSDVSIDVAEAEESSKKKTPAKRYHEDVKVLHFNLMIFITAYPVCEFVSLLQNSALLYVRLACTKYSVDFMHICIWFSGSDSQRH